MVLLTAAGDRVVEGRRVAKGGEGEVFRVLLPQGMAFKRYLPVALGRDPHLPDRVAAMVRQQPVRSGEGRRGHVLLAWPQAVVFDEGRFTGFLMPLIDTTSTVELHRATNPTDRGAATGDTAWLRGFTWRYLVRTAANLALATQAVHAAGSVIGDFNERNIRVSREALVTLLDCDSMQVEDELTGRTYLCHVGRPDFTAPELIGADWRTTVRRPSSDLFALAIHLYQLLLEGEHPFRGRWSGGGTKPTVGELARTGTWTHSGRSTLSPRPSAIGIDILPAGIRDLFRRAFEDGARNPDDRPSAALWHAALTALEGNLVNCRTRPEHVYPGAGGGCPWCALESRRTAALPAAPRQQPLPPAAAPTASAPPTPLRRTSPPPAAPRPTSPPRPWVRTPPAGGRPAGPQHQFPPTGALPASRPSNRTLPVVVVVLLVVCLCPQLPGFFADLLPDGSRSGTSRTAAPLATTVPPARALPQGTLVFSDDFSTGSGRWFERDEPDASVVVDTAVGRLDFSIEPDGIASTGPGALADDTTAASLRRVRLDVTVSRPSLPSGASFAIFCRTAPNGDSYAFHLTASGVSVVKYQSGRSSVLAESSFVPTSRRLHVECSTSPAGSAVDLRLWSGQDLVLEARDTLDVIRAGIPGGLRADLASDFGTGRFEIAVDDLAVYRL